MPVAIVIGANRGIGLSLVENLLKQEYEVLAAVRTSTSELDATQATVIAGVDTAQDGCCEKLVQGLAGRSCDLLIVSAGSQEVDVLATVTKDSIRRQFEVNALGPLFIVKELADNMAEGAKVVLISSKNGSITEVDFTGGELYAYRMSKVALNMAGAVLARDLKPRGVSVALIHPGVVNTVMLRTLRKTRGVAEDKLTANTKTPVESAAGIMKLVAGLSLENSGSFWAADTGKVIGW